VHSIRTSSANQLILRLSWFLRTHAHDTSLRSTLEQDAGDRQFHSLVQSVITKCVRGGTRTCTSTGPFR